VGRQAVSAGAGGSVGRRGAARYLQALLPRAKLLVGRAAALAEPSATARRPQGATGGRAGGRGPAVEVDDAVLEGADAHANRREHLIAPRPTSKK